MNSEPAGRGLSEGIPTTSFTLLGSVEIEDRGRAIRLAAPKQRAVLALLLLAHDEPVSVKRFQDRLWDVRPPTTATAALRNYVSALRKALPIDGGIQLSTAGDGYLLHIPRDALDVQRFVGLQQRGRNLLAAGDAPGAAQALVEALALWRGPALGDLLPMALDWPERARLEELRLVTLEQRIEADLALGRHLQLAPELERLTREHPLRETFRQQQMTALYRCGRRAHALQIYHDTRVQRQASGLPASARLRALHQAILEDTRPNGSGRPDALRGPASGAASDALTRLIDAYASRAGASRLAPAPAGPPNGGQPPAGLGCPPRHASPHNVALLATCFQLLTARGAGDPDDHYLQQLLPEVSETVRRYHGRVEYVVGSTLIASFSCFRKHDDGAERAVRAALALTRAGATLPSSGATGDCAGDVLATSSIRSLVEGGIGDGRAADWSMAHETVLNECDDLLVAGLRGRICVTASIVRGTSDIVSYKPMSWAGPSGAGIRSYAVVRLHEAPPVPAPNGAVVRLGDAELNLAVCAWERVVETSRPCLFSVVGLPGSGKTELIDEFIRRSDAAGRPLTCVHVPDLRYGFEPAGTAEPGVTLLGRLMQVIRTGRARTRSDSRDWLVLRDAVRAAGPVMVVFEHLDRQDDDVLELAERLAWVDAGVPLMVVVTARPHLQLRRPEWGNRPAREGAVVVLLPLTEPTAAMAGTPPAAPF